MNTRTGKLLLDEPPLVVLPSLAVAIGLESAVVVQQLHYLIRLKNLRHNDYPTEKERDFHDGRVWVWNTYEQWQKKYFCFMTVRSLQRIFLQLEKHGLILVSNHNDSPLNKTKWYTLNYNHPLINPFTESDSQPSIKSSSPNDDQRKTVVDRANLAPSTCQLGTMDHAKTEPSITKTSLSKTSTHTTTTAESSLSNQYEKDGTKEFSPTNTFPIPQSSEEEKLIIKDVMHIVYPYDAQIRNKNNLVASLRKKLKAGMLEVPEGWETWQKNKKENSQQNVKSEKIADEKKTFLKLREEFENLPQNEKNQYLETQRKKNSSISSFVTDETIIRVAVMSWSQEKIANNPIL
jgi:hypothetical protein